MTGLSTFVAVLLAIAGGVVYHLAAKSIPRDAAPTLVLVVAYAAALSISGVAYLALPREPAAASAWRLLHPGILGLGLGAAMIELGYVLTYRTGAPVSLTSALVNGVVAALLVPVGILAYGERMSVAKAAGIALCLAGAWLVRL
jgi:drug/metabolite transporter (DMT)-like permease